MVLLSLNRDFQHAFDEFDRLHLRDNVTP
jgi:hypothetical protein